MLCRMLALILINIPAVLAQLSTSASNWQTPNDCGPTEFYNAVNLRCTQCPQGTIPARTESECTCPPGTIPSQGADGAMKCAQCARGLAVDRSGVECVQCHSSNGSSLPPDQSTGICPLCGSNEISIITRQANNRSQVARQICESCPNGTVPNAAGDACEPCSNSECFCRASTSSQCKPSAQTVGADIYLENGDRFRSLYVQQNLAYAEAKCRTGNRQACQQLANLCVLQDYNRDAENACTLLEAIQRNTLNSQSLIPPIFYASEASVELFRETALDAVFTVSPGSVNSELTLIVASFTLNGTFLGLFEASQGLLQLCPVSQEVEKGAFVFGRLYKETCRRSVSEILSWDRRITDEFGGGTPMFHELYLRFVNTQGQRMVYPISVLNENLRSRSEYVNRQSGERDSRWVLTKRFFLVDRQSEATGAGELLRVPVHVSFHVHLQLSRDGRIFPPHLRIRHAEFHTANDGQSGNQSSTQATVSEEKVEVGFSMNYVIDSFRHDKTIEVLMATLCSCSVIWSAVRAYSWGRRAGKLIADASTVIKFVLYGCENIANIFLLVMGCTAVWLTFAYKLQKHMVYVMLTFEQEWSFVAYMISAAALKLVSLFHTYATLALTETFFIDWERPRATADRSRETTMLDISTARELGSQKPKKAQPVVIWRTYLIANEWNELQSYRKTNVACQMLMLLALLEYFDFADWAKVQPGFARGGEPPEFAETRMSRFAVDLTCYFAIGLTQWLIHVLIIEKVTDPFRNFMDLCSMANVSVIAFTHPQRAYYIHGRSVHGMADTDMMEMNDFLRRERENLCGLRGLENGSELQTFVACLPRAFRERLDELTAPLRHPPSGATIRLLGNSAADRATAKVENRAKVYNEINQFMKEVIDHANPNCDYVVTDARFVEEAIDIELADTSKMGNFIRDPSEMAYSSAFIYGNEWVNMSFEMLLFCVLDMALRNRIFAVTITYVVATLMHKVSKVFFTNNLIKSSLVDHRFLI